MTCVGVVIATRNRRPTLEATLERLLALPERPPIVVVDNASGDRTAAAVRSRFGAAVRVVALKTNRGAGARNVGLRAIGTSYAAICDDDSWWAPDALVRAAAALDRAPRVAVLAARVLVGPEARLDPACARMRDSPLSPATGLAIPRVLGFVACGTVVRTAAVLGVGGFDERYGIGGEEHRLALDLAAAGWELAYAAHVVAHHHPAARSRPHDDQRAHTACNDLWTTWLRLPRSAALRRSIALLRSADGVALRAAVRAIRGLPWVVRERRPVDRGVQRDLRLLERA
jgi:N-acetylglucosaminyl-diphospho-decaprenol L-rhamnosyltransferase